MNVVSSLQSMPKKCWRIFPFIEHNMKTKMNQVELLIFHTLYSVYWRVYHTFTIPLYVSPSVFLSTFLLAHSLLLPFCQKILSFCTYTLDYNSRYDAVPRKGEISGITRSIYFQTHTFCFCTTTLPCSMLLLVLWRNLLFKSNVFESRVFAIMHASREKTVLFLHHDR